MQQGLQQATPDSHAIIAGGLPEMLPDDFYSASWLR
jgi:hypothetical protein